MEYTALQEKIREEVLKCYKKNGTLDADKLKTKLQNLGVVIETEGTRFPMTVGIDGKVFEIDSSGTIEKTTAKIITSNLKITKTDGTEITESSINKPEEGTAVIVSFDVEIAEGTITAVNKGTLANGKVEYTTDGTETEIEFEFTIMGTSSEEGDGTEYIVQLSQYYKANTTSGRTAKTSNRTLSGTTDTTKMTYKNPVIPQGFIAIDTESAKWEYENEETLDEVEGWNNGLVIKDDLDNEFVWVPCTTGTSDDVVTYSKKYDYPTYISSPSSSNLIDATDTQKISGVEYKAIPVIETTQINTYGGFYVARYEAGLASATNDPETSKHVNNNYNCIPVSKYGSKVWNYVDYDHSYVAAQKMINNSTKYGNNKSGLITGTQWDTIMKWLEGANIGVLISNQNWGTYRTLTYNYTGTQNSSHFTYGNSVGAWSNGAFSHTGSNNITSDSNKAYFHASGLNTSYKLANSDTLISGYPKNIADLGGNFAEWTSEVSLNDGTDYRVSRGGNARYTGGNDEAASSRTDDKKKYNYESLGYRVVLYIQ